MQIVEGPRPRENTIVYDDIRITGVFSVGELRRFINDLPDPIAEERTDVGFLAEILPQPIAEEIAPQMMSLPRIKTNPLKWFGIDCKASVKEYCVHAHDHAYEYWIFKNVIMLRRDETIRMVWVGEDVCLFGKDFKYSFNEAINHLIYIVKNPLFNEYYIPTPFGSFTAGNSAGAIYAIGCTSLISQMPLLFYALRIHWPFYKN